MLSNSGDVTNLSESFEVLSLKLVTPSLLLSIRFPLVTTSNGTKRQVKYTMRNLTVMFVTAVSLLASFAYWQVVHSNVSFLGIYVNSETWKYLQGVLKVNDKKKAKY